MFKFTARQTIIAKQKKNETKQILNHKMYMQIFINTNIKFAFVIIPIRS